MLTEELVDATVLANQVVLNNNHMVGIKTDDGIRIIKCQDKPKLVGTMMERRIWNNYQVYKVNDGVPRRALVHLRNEDGTVYRKSNESSNVN